jgi:hypothetical protein
LAGAWLQQLAWRCWQALFQDATVIGRGRALITINK